MSDKTYTQIKKELTELQTETEKNRLRIVIFCSSPSAGWRPDFDSKKYIEIGTVKVPLNSRKTFFSKPAGWVTVPNFQQNGLKTQPESIQKLNDLLVRAGANLPTPFRNQLDDFCCHTGVGSVGWWVTLILLRKKKFCIDSNGKDIEKIVLDHPVFDSIDLIKECKLGTRSPRLLNEPHPAPTEKVEKPWADHEPGPESGFIHGPIEGELKQIAVWTGIERRVLRGGNMTRSWYVQKIHARRYRAWFTSEKVYSKANGKRLAETT